MSMNFRLRKRNVRVLREGSALPVAIVEIPVGLDVKRTSRLLALAGPKIELSVGSAFLEQGPNTHPPPSYHSVEPIEKISRVLVRLHWRKRITSNVASENYSTFKIITSTVY